MAKKNGGHTSTAVMSRRRAAEDNEGLNDEERLWKLLDFFATPPWGARAGLEHAKKLWPEARTMREPACGKMHIAMPAQEYFAEVLPTDVHPHDAATPIRDWLDDAVWPEEPDCDIMMTNPPFQLADEFVIKGLQRARLGIGLLLRLNVLEGVDRHTLMEGPRARLTQVATFSERLPMTLGVWDPGASSATAYAWFFWSKVHEPMAPAWFPPGTRDRLWRKDDAARFGKLTPMPLFDPPAHFDVI